MSLEQRRIYMRAWYKANREKILAGRKRKLEKLKKDNPAAYAEHNKRQAATNRKAYAKTLKVERAQARDVRRDWVHRRENWEYIMWRNAKERARVKNLPFDLIPSEIVIPDVCPVLGMPLFKQRGHLRENSPSLDRIKPALGYVKSNIRVISQRANRLKCDGTAAEMLLVYQDLLRIEAA